MAAIIHSLPDEILDEVQKRLLCEKAIAITKKKIELSAGLISLAEKHPGKLADLILECYP